MLNELDIVKVKGKKGCYILLNVTKKDIFLRTFKIGLNLFGGFKYGNDPANFNSYETLLPFPSDVKDIKIIGKESDYSITELKEVLY
jgi:hypothetical protein